MNDTGNKISLTRIVVSIYDKEIQCKIQFGKYFISDTKITT